MARNILQTRWISGAMLGVCLLLLPGTVWGWGFWAHRHITQLALFALPPDLLQFYKPHVAYLVAQSVNPDKRRYVNPQEAPRHYIDLEVYGQPPFDQIPQRWAVAQQVYGDDSLHRHGILPWHAELLYRELRAAFQAHNGPRVLYLSAELSHYLADACVPLHTTRNYDGQLTGQRGIHHLWESRLPEVLGAEFVFYTGKVTAVPNAAEVIWAAVRQSHAEVDLLLSHERRLRTSTPTGARLGLEPNGQTLRRVVSQDYVRRYHSLLNGQVEGRLRASVSLVATIWVTAWVEAGQPRADQLRFDTPLVPEVYDHTARLLQLTNDREPAPADSLNR